MKMKMIVRPFEFSKEALIDRWEHWIAEWLNLFAVIVYLITLGYADPIWKFTWLTRCLQKKYTPPYK